MTAPEVLGGGRYRIEAQLGQGAMGSVHRAIDTTTGEAVALKCLRSDHSERKRERAELRFRREFHTLASLEHPHIIGVFDYFVDDVAGPFYTMELLSGSDLGDHVGRLGWQRTCRVLRDVASALTRLHTRGMVHRDLAPRNVRLTAEGRAKVIDFGVLANVGVSRELAGTIPYIAPETVRGMPIDGRADLYALGTLAYALLTRRHPYPARKLDELERAWLRSPVPPAELTDDCPDALSELIVALLSLDPLARPASAAEVIERLTSVGGLEPIGPDELSHGFLASAAMVGRQAEMARIKKAISRVTRAKGGTVFVAADSGAGKSRLLSEVEVEAKLAGAVVARVSCEGAAARPYGAAAALLGGLLRSMPADAREAVRPHAPVLARVFPDVAHLAEGGAPVAAATDPAEERLRIQRALADAVLGVARKKPLVLVVDDLQRADEASAAVLASLSRDGEARKLLVVAALRTDEPVRAPVAVEALRQARTRIALGGLDVAGVEELLRSLFGDVPRVPRLALYLHRATGGSPLHCTELARHLVDRGAIRNVDGAWTLPAELDQDVRPLGLADAMEERVRALSNDARTLAEALSIAGGELPLDLVVRLAPALDADAVFAVLDELAEQGVLVGDRSSFRFRHDSLREALLRRLPPEVAKALHVRVAEGLLSRGEDDDAREAEIGWHFRDGGDDARAVGYLERAGRRLFDAQALSDCIAPLEAALAIHDRLSSPPARPREILAMLVNAGWVSKREVGLAHAERAIGEWRRHSGVALAARLGPFVGKHLAFSIAIAVAGVKHLLSPESRRGPGPFASLLVFSKTLGCACAIYNASNHLDELRRLIVLVEPLAVFRKRLIYVSYLTMRSFEDLLCGRLGAAVDKLSETIDILERDRLTPMAPEERRLAEAIVRGLRALADVNQQDPRMHEDLTIVDSLGFRYYSLVARSTLVVHHRFRGEEARARQIEASIESATLALGAWSTDVQILIFAHLAYAICRDVMGLKRSLDDLERRVAEGMRFEHHVWMTKGDIARERGDYEESFRCLRQVWDTLPTDDTAVRQWIGSSIAQTALDAGDFAQAAEVSRRVVALGAEPITGLVLPRWRAERTLALAEDALGDRSAAVERLERAIRETEAAGVPSMAGLVHEARARVALSGDDRAGYLHHANEANRFFRGTDNPALIAIGERLLDAGHRRSRHAPTRRRSSIAPGASESHGAVDRGPGTLPDPSSDETLASVASDEPSTSADSDEPTTSRA